MNITRYKVITKYNGICKCQTDRFLTNDNTPKSFHNEVVCFCVHAIQVKHHRLKVLKVFTHTSIT